MKSIIIFMFSLLSVVSYSQEVDTTNFDSILAEQLRPWRSALVKSDTALIKGFSEELKASNCSIDLFSAFIESNEYSWWIKVALINEMIKNEVCLNTVVDNISYYDPFPEIVNVETAYKVFPIFFSSIDDSNNLKIITDFLIYSDYLGDCKYYWNLSEKTKCHLSDLLVKRYQDVNLIEKLCGLDLPECIVANHLFLFYHEKNYRR